MIDLAVEQDFPKIEELLRGRPGALNDEWSPPRALYFVYREDGEIVAFIAGHVDGNVIICDQLEIERQEGRPTPAGIRGARKLSDFMNDAADKDKLRIYCVVGVNNDAQNAIMARPDLHYALDSYVYRRDPQPYAGGKDDTPSAGES